MTVGLRDVKIAEAPEDTDYTTSSKDMESDESSGSDDSDVVNQVV